MSALPGDVVECVDLRKGCPPVLITANITKNVSELWYVVIPFSSGYVFDTAGLLPGEARLASEKQSEHCYLPIARRQWPGW